MASAARMHNIARGGPAAAPPRRDVTSSPRQDALSTCVGSALREGAGAVLLGVGKIGDRAVGREGRVRAHPNRKGVVSEGFATSASMNSVELEEVIAEHLLENWAQVLDHGLALAAR